MPVLHRQYSIQGKAPDGSSVDVPSMQALQIRGPLVQVTIGIEHTIAQQLLQTGQTLPPPVAGLAMIDTGASVTCVDEGVAQQLGLPAIDVVQMVSASHASTQQNVYPIRLEVVGVPIVINVARAIGAQLAAQGIQVLIGRDIMANLTLFYNGPAVQITVAI